ncbi:MAG: hypothetical protein A4E20_12125 [Nitrospira sp. SG-bin2]|nr:MAG: hypothetical protein A4E20_12125 [Nitrospira sp. SG-bin2]
MDREFLRLCREASYYVAQYAERNRSGHAPVFLREFLEGINKAEHRLGQESAPQPKENAQ